jgi:hypothetical protein
MQKYMYESLGLRIKPRNLKEKGVNKGRENFMAICVALERLGLGIKS